MAGPTEPIEQHEQPIGGATRGALGGARGGALTELPAEPSVEPAKDPSAELPAEAVVDGKAGTAKKPRAAKKSPRARGTRKQVLLIVESPAKGKTIEKYLGKGYTVAASMGHLIDLPKSRLAIDVENSFEPEYITVRGKAKILKELKQKARKADTVLLASDNDREGEAISFHLRSALQNGAAPREIQRITFNEITPKAIREAVAHPGSHRHGQGQRAEGAPGPGPDRGILPLASPVEEGKERPLRGPRAVRCAAADLRAGGGDRGLPPRGVLDAGGRASQGPNHVPSARSSR